MGEACNWCQTELKIFSHEEKQSPSNHLTPRPFTPSGGLPLSERHSVVSDSFHVNNTDGTKI